METITTPKRGRPRKYPVGQEPKNSHISPRTTFTIPLDTVAALDLYSELVLNQYPLFFTPKKSDLVHNAIADGIRLQLIQLREKDPAAYARAEKAISEKMDLQYGKMLDTHTLLTRHSPTAVKMREDALVAHTHDRAALRMPAGRAEMGRKGKNPLTQLWTSNLERSALLGLLMRSGEASEEEGVMVVETAPGGLQDMQGYLEYVP